MMLSSTLPPSIFYIEDNPGDILLMRNAFFEIGREVTFVVAFDGEQGMQRLDEFVANNSPAARPDLILLDLNLPKANGFEVLAHLQEEPRLPIPVVVLTTSNHADDRERCVKIGCAAFLRKPLTFPGYRTLALEIDRVFASRH